MKSNLLFLTPVYPDVHGNGRQKRAALWIAQLSHSFLVHTVICRMEESHDADQRGECILEPAHRNRYRVKVLKNLLRGNGVVPLHWVEADQYDLNGMKNYLATGQIAVVFSFRFYLFPLAKRIGAEHGVHSLWLDMDDIESNTLAEIAKIEWYRGRFRKVLSSWVSSRIYRKLEKNLLPDIEKVYVCSAHDKDFLRQFHSSVEIFPNKVFSRNWLAGSAPGCRGLFIGQLDYAPNYDAVLTLLDLANALVSQGYRPLMVIVGECTNKLLISKMLQNPWVVYKGKLDSLEQVYMESYFVICPLRAGGGTRLKILEAFNIGRPVITTSKGIEGIDAEDGKHALISPDVVGLVDKIKLLLHDPGLYAHLRKNARTLSEEKYTF